MVKKIQGKKTGRTTGAAPVQPTKTIESGKVGKVDQVKASETQSAPGKIGSAGRKITPEIENQLMQLIDEEADKLLGGEKGLSESKKKTVKGAVKMAIQASILSDEENEEKK